MTWKQKMFKNLNNSPRGILFEPPQQLDTKEYSG